MPVYAYAGLAVSSSLPLTELHAIELGDAAVPDFAFNLTRASAEPVPESCLHQWATGGSASAMSLYRTHGGFLLRFPELADFWIDAEARRIGACPAPETAEETIRHLLLDQVLPRLLAHRGQLTVHSAGIRVGPRIIAFIGQTGRGKSTLAASFHLAGDPVLTDDGLVLTRSRSGVLAQATYASVRLWPQAVAGLFTDVPPLGLMAQYSPKKRLLVQRVSKGEAVQLPLAALYVLAPETHSVWPTISLARLSQRDACMAIIQNSFQLDVSDRRRVARLLEDAAAIAAIVPTFELAFPREYDRLAEVRATILSSQPLWAHTGQETAKLM